MPTRGSYQIARQDEHKAAQRDQSYRSCVATLLIFFMMCMVILIACIPWKKYGNSDIDKKEEESSVMASHYSNEPVEASRSVITTTAETTTGTLKEVYTQNSISEHYYTNITTTIKPLKKDILETTHDTMNTFSNDVSSKDSQDPNKTTVEKINTTNQPELHYNDTGDTASSNDHKIFESTRQEETSTISTILMSEVTQNNSSRTEPYSEISEYSTASIDTTPVSNSGLFNQSTSEDKYATVEEVNNTETTTSQTTFFYITNSSELFTTTDSTVDNSEINKFTTESNNSTVIEKENSSTQETLITTEFTTEEERNYTTNTGTTTESNNFTVIEKENTSTQETLITTEFTTEEERNYTTNTGTTTESNNFTVVEKENTSTQETLITTEFTTEEERNYTTNTGTTTESNNFTVVEKENTSTQETLITTEFTTEEERNYTTNIGTTTESNTITTSVAEHNKTYNSGHFIHGVAQMLFFMNHSADPCEDFYEYACGGMVADSQIIDLNLDSKAYHRIAKQTWNNNNDEAASLLSKYYSSCMEYENTISIKERIELVKEAVNKIGTFYTTRDINSTPDNGDFTTIYAKLLLSYSPLLFDVKPDLNEYNSNSYTISIGPILNKYLFDSEKTDDLCRASVSETQQPFVNLESLYQDYIECKQNNRWLMKSINDALTELEIFNMDDIEQNVAIIVHSIDTEIVQGFFSKFPSEAEIRETYLTKKYTKVLMEELNKTTTFINWDRLTYMLMNNNMERGAHVQVYFYKELIDGLKHLENFWMYKPNNFHNAILGLYAHKLYRDLVVSKHEDIKQHCLQISINLLRPEASYLYMSALSDKKIAYINHTIWTFFNELKETLKLKIQTTEWIMDEQRHKLLSKINDLSLSVPEMSYFQYEENNKLSLSDNYINNTLILMKRYRSSIYSVKPFVINPTTPKQIWTRYATPFQSKAVVVYGLDLVIIPFGAIDYGNMFIDDEAQYNYLIWATIGNLIARQISHHFDVNGMYYWNKTRHNSHLLINSDGIENQLFGNYISCHKNIIYKDPINMTLPLTSQAISFKISERTLNARLSEIMGLKLTYDTLTRIKLFPENHLPWPKLDVKQLFYLTYAQMYCTKSLLTTSYTSLHINEELPSRIRVFVSASSNKLLGQLWHCSHGSQVLPSDTCDVFPDFTYDYDVPSA